MGRIQDLPKEIILPIYKNLDAVDVRQCQYLCRTLYFQSHGFVWKDISLNGFSNLQKFTAAINDSANPYCVNAVQTLCVSNLEGRQSANISKLLIRFPNLQHVKLVNTTILANEFQHHTCKTILKKCPELDTFELSGYDNEEHYTETVDRVRLLLTSIDNPMIHRSATYDPVEYMIRFPRLQKIDDSFNEFNSVDQWLDLAEHLSNLKSIYLSEPLPEENFVFNSYFKDKTYDEQEELLTRLLRITRVDLSFENGYCEHLLEFIYIYLTGCEIFQMVDQDSHDWDEEELDSFCRDALPLACTAKKEGKIRLEAFIYESFRDIYPWIFDIIFFRHDTERTNLLILNTCHDDEAECLSISTEPLVREIYISILDNHSLHELIPVLFGEYIYPIDEFYLKHDYRDDIITITDKDLDMYEELLTYMPDLKKMTMQIPIFFRKEHPQERFDDTYPLLENLTLIGCEDLDCQILLDRFCYLFPNLKCLGFEQFSGIFCERSNEFKLSLESYSLERLIIDLSPIRHIMYEDVSTRFFQEGDYALVKIELSGSKSIQIYKVPFDSSAIEKIHDLEDLHSMIVPCYPVHVCISRLRYLEVVDVDLRPSYESRQILIE